MGSVVDFTEKVFGMVKRVTIDWTSSGSSTGIGLGTATGESTKYYDGEVLRINCLPNTTSGYGIEINDSDGTDLLGGQGAALTSGGYDFGTSTGGSLSYPLSVVSGKLSLNVTATCGAGSTGVAIVYVR